MASQIIGSMDDDEADYEETREAGGLLCSRQQAFEGVMVRAGVEFTRTYDQLGERIAKARSDARWVGDEEVLEALDFGLHCTVFAYALVT